MILGADCGIESSAIDSGSSNLFYDYTKKVIVNLSNG
ncbi:MAG: hypothetical protein DF168_01285 [Candidatus Moanabacter tarae]|uniref:Uncharacterized protein n=1 Tax=Candidatus Moanibacter tarae TaxID=2200854 RepID=A0A2Z4AIA6_9BACT|nr:MAG: hypothetical protein DF168_01285 [Candidatus Moanabacter tarae]